MTSDEYKKMIKRIAMEMVEAEICDRNSTYPSIPKPPPDRSGSQGDSTATSKLG